MPGYGLWQLIVKLSLARDELGAGDILQLTATDPGAPEDILLGVASPATR